MTISSRSSRPLSTKHNGVDRVCRSINVNTHEPQSQLRYSTSESLAHFGQQQHFSTRISPPPLKRQCKETIASGVLSKRPNLAHQSVGQSSHQSEVERSLTGSRHSSSCSVPLNAQNGCRSDRDVLPTSGLPGCPDPSFKASSSGKRTCRVCNRTSATKYNPIIVCPFCQRLYHDSCRKPPLAERTDPKLWRCQKCQGKPLQHKVFSLAVSRPPLSSSNATPIAQLSSESRVKATKYTDLEARLSSHSIPISCNHVPVASTFSSLNDQTISVTHNPSSEGCKHEENKSPERLPKYLRPLSIDGRMHSFSSDKPDMQIARKLDERIMDSGKSNVTRESSEQFHIVRMERTEVPNTPTQRSSQIYPPAPSPQIQYPHNDDLNGTIDLSLLVEQSQPEGASIGAIFCPGCQKQRFFAKKSNSRIDKCKKCLGRSPAEEAGPLMIPETPNASSSTQTNVQSSSQGQNLTSIASELISTPSISILGPEIALSRNSHCAVTTYSSRKSNLLTTEGTAMDEILSDRTAHVSNQDAYKANTTSLFEIDLDPEKKNLKTAQEPLLRDGTEDAATQVEPLPQLPPLPLSRENSAIELGHSMHDGYNQHFSNNVPSNKTNDMNTSVTGELSAELPLLSTSVATTDNLPNAHSSLVFQVPEIPMTAVAASAPIEKVCTKRELVRMALVAADGLPLTSIEIIAWIAHNFPQLHAGNAWKRGIEAILSRFDEFEMSDVGITSETQFKARPKQYKLVSTGQRVQYEKESSHYRINPELSPAESYPISATDNENNAAQSPQTENKKQYRMAVKSAPTQCPHDCVKAQRSHPSVVIPRKSSPTPTLTALVKPCPVKRTLPRDIQCEDPNFIPFQRLSSCRPQSTLNFNQGIRKGTRPRCWKSPIKIMTQADIDQKIAEIKSRPPRKRFFGPDYRLAHVRRYERRDIHDELEEIRKVITSKIDVEMAGAEEALTLRQVLRLPENAIPMNDGQSELAFRDGVLVNGRLPRPRQIYKVGKMFGGELTIRTS